MVLALPPQHGSGVAVEHPQGVGGLGNIEAKALLGLQVKEPMLGHPLPQHVLSVVTLLGYYPVIQRLDTLARVFIDDGEWIIP